MNVLVLLIFATLFTSRHAHSYKILGLFPYPAKSHYACFDPLMLELAKRGHRVTVYSPFPKTHRIPNYEEVDLSACFTSPNFLSLGEMRLYESDPFLTTRVIFEFMPNHHQILSCEPLRRLFNSTEKFDVLVTEFFNTEFFTLFGWRLKVPVITFHTHSPLAYHADRMGLPDDPSYIPHPYKAFPRRLKFFQRVQNTLLRVWSTFLYAVCSERFYDELASKFYGAGVPSIRDAAKNASMLFLYTHFSIYRSRPIVPNVIEVAGLHIGKSNTLPEVSKTVWDFFG